MKKAISFLFAFLAVNLAWAKDVSETEHGSSETRYLDEASQLYFYLNTEDGVTTAEITYETYMGSDNTDYVSGDYVLPEYVYVGDVKYEVTAIDNSAFRGCNNLTSITFPQNLKKIGSYAFIRAGLKSIYIPASVEYINWGAFMYCDYVETISFDPDAKPLLERYVFDRIGSKIESSLTVTIPKGITLLDNGTFRNCYTMKWVTFSDDSECSDIEYHSFQNCNALETVYLPASLEILGNAIFSFNSTDYFKSMYCRAEAAPSIKDDTFKNTEEATLYVSNPSNYSAWASYFKEIVEYQFPDLEVDGVYYKITSDNEVQVVSGPIPYEGEIEIPTTFTRNKTEYTVSSIASDAFSNVDGDLIVTISFTDPSVISTGDATANENVTIKAPVGYKNIFSESDLKDYFTIDGDPITDTYGNSYYYYNDEDEGLLLELVAIPEDATDITIPATVNDVAVSKVAEDVFTDASSLKTVTMLAEVPPFESSAFTGIPDGEVVLYVDNVENYTADADNWHDIFIVYGYIEAGDTFSDETFAYIVLENEDENNEDEETGWTVQITDIVTESTEFGISTNVSYNGLSFTVTKIAASAFDGKSGLIVSVTFTDPSDVTIVDASSDELTTKIGTLNVPSDDNVTAFGNSGWATYFEIANYNYGTIFVENGISYMVNEDNETVTIVAFTCAESVTIPETAGGYTVNAVADGVFSCADLKYVTMEAEEPPFSASAFEGIPEGVVLYVDNNVENYTTAEDNWHDYFIISGYIEAGDTFELDGLEYKVTEVTDGTQTVEIVGVTASEVEIKTEISYNNLGFNVKSIANGAFSKAENLSVTVDADIIESITLGTIADGNIGELNVPDDSAWDYYLSPWSNYFKINATLSFETTELIYTVTDQARKYVEISGVVTGVKTFEITTTVMYNEDIEFTVKSINEYAFDDCSGLKVTVAFTNPSTVTFNGYYAEPLGTLTVTSNGYRDLFGTTNWGKYFDVTGDPYYENGVNYYFQRDGSATVDSIDSEAEIIIFTDTVNGYTVETIEESVFEGYVDLNVKVTVINPYTITLSPRTATVSKYGKLTVPDGCGTIYAESTWNDYFEIDGVEYYDGGAGVYYVFVVTAVEYDDEDWESEYMNKSLKATSVKYEISLEVAYVDADATEITIPRTIDLGDSSTTYEVTSMNADALKDCKDLVAINLEASIPVEDIEALNYTPDACVIVVDEEKLGTEYCESVMAAAAMVGIEVKMASTAIVEIQVTSDKVEVARYNLLGQKITAPTRGINIVMYSDGTVEKVLVK